MTDIGITVCLEGAVLGVPSVPGNGQEGIPSNDVAFTGTDILLQSVDDNGDTFLNDLGSYKNNGTVNLPIPITVHYYLSAILSFGGTREFWTDITPSLTNSPSGEGAYVSGSLVILGQYSITGSIAIPEITEVFPVVGDPANTFNVSIIGSNFIDGATVTFNGVSATNIEALASNLISCTTPIIGTIGSVDILVTNPNYRSTGISGNGLLTTIADPVVTSITPNSGGNGTVITDLHGTGFYPGATIIIGGIAATSVVWVSSSQLTCIAGSGTIGSADVVVTNITGQTSGTSGNGLFTFVFNITDLDLKIYFHSADYNAVTKTILGRTTAGTSDTMKGFTSGAAPSAGATLNGIQTMHFDRSLGQKLEVQNISGGSQTSPIHPVPAGDWTFFGLYNFDPTGAPNNPTTSAYDNETLMADVGSNRWIPSVRTGKVQMTVYNGAFTGCEAAATDNVYQLLIARGNGTIIEVRQGSGAWASVSDSYVFVGNGLTIGQSTNSGATFLGNMAVLGLAWHYYDDAIIANIVSAINTEWGLSL